jgi:hypothetical protein
VFYDYDPQGGTARLRREREEEARRKAERERQQAARRTAIRPRLEAALRAAEAGSVDGMRQVIALIGEPDRITVDVRQQMPEGASAFAIWQTRTIVIPPIVDGETFAVALHEAGHVLAGDCTGREPHRPDRSVTRWHHCIACEVNAWAEALKLAPFSRAMFERLQQSLRTYRRTTPAAAAEIARLDRVAGTVNWALEREKRRRFAEMEARLARARRGL